jgi:hypothetical protein
MLAPKVTFPDAGYTYTYISVDKNGHIHAFWIMVFDRFGQNYEQIMHKTSFDGGNNWTEISNITPQYTDTGQIIADINVVCDSENNLHLMFLRGTEWSKVMHMKYDGSSWTEPASIYDYAVNYLHVAVDSNDRIYSVWYSDPSYYSYYEGGIWATPKSINDEFLPSIKDIAVDRNDNVYACGLVDTGHYAPFYCKYDKATEKWTDFEQIEGYDERSIASALTLSKNDTLNINVSIGPTLDENVNYNLKRKIGEASWSLPQYINENTDMLNKDFFCDHDNNLHLFEKSTDDSSLVYSVYNGDGWIEDIVQYEIDHNFWLQSTNFDYIDQFYTVYVKIYYETNERAVFFQKKKIQVGIEDQNESIIEEYKLFQNYPNPFNPVTTISYMLSNPACVKLAVYSLNGQLLQTLVSEKKGRGIHKVHFNASDLSSGMYFYNLAVDGKNIQNMKMLYIR